MPDLYEQTRAALSSDAELDELRELLVAYRSAGGSQADACEILARLLRIVPLDDPREDRLLEMMDFASGWCQPRYAVWP